MSEVMRAEFEKWAGSCGMDLYRAERNMRTDDGVRLGKGAYICMETRFAWSAWEAATIKAYGDGHRAGFESGMKSAHPFEPAASMQDDSPRMMAIGQNGNDGEHYE